jgi:hypothetical protein
MIGIVGGSAKGGLDVASIPKIRPKSKKKSVWINFSVMRSFNVLNCTNACL